LSKQFAEVPLKIAYFDKVLRQSFRQSFQDTRPWDRRYLPTEEPYSATGIGPRLAEADDQGKQEGGPGSKLKIKSSKLKKSSNHQTEKQR